MKLYIMPGACSLAAHIALNWVGASFEVVVLSPEQTSGEEYRRINPKGVVPALVLDDGAVITEALAVLAYVADAYPGAGLGADPSDVMERTRLNEALADLVTNIHDAWSPVYVPDRFWAVRPMARPRFRTSTEAGSPTPRSWKGPATSARRSRRRRRS
jgi:glutathione S-transferase